MHFFYGADLIFVTEGQTDEEDEACGQMGKERETATNTATA